MKEYDRADELPAILFLFLSFTNDILPCEFILLNADNSNQSYYVSFQQYLLPL
jgi:hypothetical protein